MTPATAELEVTSFAEQVAEDMKDDRLELPGFPEAVLRIQRTLQSPDASADDVVKILSSEPALAARALQIANSVQFRRGDHEITDLRTAVSRLGFNLVRSVAVAFAIRQLRLRETYSASARAEIEAIWRDSVKVASVCYVLAKHCTKVNPDQALLAGLLHVLGRLYIVMRAEGIGGAANPEIIKAASGWQAEIGKAILSSWGLPEALQDAVEHQDDLDYDAASVSVTHVLIAGKCLAGGMQEDVKCAAVERIAAVKDEDPLAVLERCADELRVLGSTLGD